MTSAPAKRADMIVHEQEPYNAEPPRAALAEHVITPVEVFYGRNHGTMPEIDAGAWRLRVGGMVEHALEFSLTELQHRFAPVEVTATLQCAGNRRAGLMAYRDISGQHPWEAGATSTARSRRRATGRRGRDRRRPRRPPAAAGGCAARGREPVQRRRRAHRAHGRRRRGHR